ncbi:MAG: hypothetical protein QMB19_04530 [Burkholderiaceae bacterium]|jgi:hypothetical protein
MADTSAASCNLPVIEGPGKTPDMARYGKEKAAPLIGRLLKTCAAQVSHACNNTWPFMRNVDD